MQKKSKKYNGTTYAERKKLSIQFSLDGFSFCVKNADTKQILSYTDYSFKKTITSPELLLEKVMYIFANDTDLQQDFSNVFAVHQNNLATVVPLAYFNRNKLKAYLQFTVKTLATDFLTYDSLKSINAYNVYIPYVNINNFIFQNFGEFKYKHHSSILIEKLKTHTNSFDKMPIIYAYVSTSQLDIIVFKQQILYLYNSFLYQTKEDFIYYILFVAEQLQLNPEELSLVFLGKIEKNFDLYNITYKYIRDVKFIKSYTSFFEEKDTLSNHSSYILLS
ncbi:MAG: DUF3822 family protein [Tenacibaculum sp.]